MKPFCMKAPNCIHRHDNLELSIEREKGFKQIPFVPEKSSSVDPYARIFCWNENVVDVYHDAGCEISAGS